MRRTSIRHGAAHRRQHPLREVPRPRRRPRPARCDSSRLLLAHVPGARVERARPTSGRVPRGPSRSTSRSTSSAAAWAAARRRRGRAPPRGARLRRAAARRDGARGRARRGARRRTSRSPRTSSRRSGASHGYEHVRPEAPLAPMRPARLPPARAPRARGREVVSPRPRLRARSPPTRSTAREAEALGVDPAACPALANPLSAEQDRLELTYVPNLLQAVATNQRARARGRLWEWTRLFPPARRAGGCPPRWRVFAAVTWDRPRDDPRAASSATRSRTCACCSCALGVAAPTWPRASRPSAPACPRPLAPPGPRGGLRAGSEVLAVVGEVAPAVRRAFGLEGRVTARRDRRRPRCSAPRRRRGAEYAPVPPLPGRAVRRGRDRAAEARPPPA